MNLTVVEIVTLQALVELHIQSLCKALRDPRITEGGRQGYARELAAAEVLREKLRDAAVECMRQPEYGT